MTTFGKPLRARRGTHYLRNQACHMCGLGAQRGLEAGFKLLLARLRIWGVSGTAKFINSLFTTEELYACMHTWFWTLFPNVSTCYYCKKGEFGLSFIHWGKSDSRNPTPGAIGYVGHEVGVFVCGEPRRVVHLVLHNPYTVFQCKKRLA